MSARASYGIDAPGVPLGLAAGGLVLVVVAVVGVDLWRSVALKYAERLSSLWHVEVTQRPLGWLFLDGVPWMGARLVTDQKPGG